MEDRTESVEDAFLLQGYNDASSYSQESLRSILIATKASNALPSAGDDFDYYSTFQGFRAFLSQKRQTILSLMTKLIQNQGIREKFQDRELEEKFDLLIDVNDAILENVSTNIDDAKGLRKSEEDELLVAVKPVNTINTSWNKRQFNSSSPKSLKLLTAKNIVRPQLNFKDKIDNSSSLFVPIIKEKPNSIKPLAIIVEKEGDKEEFCHPYECEIEKFTPHERILQPKEVIPPRPLEDTPLVMVNTVEDLKKLCAELKQKTEIAVDLEHHSYRSFQGFTCLMQISTREKDYILDVLDLRSDLQILNDVFTDPNIVKVFHGADMDILWLQRDFGVYVVNLFDTGQAAQVLHFAHLSLSYLIKHYCKFDLDKQFQLADWRIRPLPEEMIKYARQDTHYLLYVYDCLKRDLIANGNELNNLLLSTFDRSKMICLKKYEKPLFDENKYLDFYKKSKKVLNAKQLYCLKRLYAWRDRIARENDESLGYVLPNHMLMQIAEVLPREQQGILACCNPIPPLVKQQLNELHSIVLKANDSSLRQLEMQELQQQAQSHKVHNHIDLGDLLQCPHDILHLENKASHSTSESYASLPFIRQEPSAVSLQKKRPALTALFERPPKKMKKSPSNEKKTENVDAVIKTLISPFQRYQVTEDLQSEQKETEQSADGSPEMAASSAIPHENTQVEEEESQSNSIESAVCHEPLPTYQSTPVQKKKKKKKLLPDVSLIVPSSSPAAKSKPEVIVLDDSFKPYDYSQVDHRTFTSNSKSKDGKNERNNSKSHTPDRKFSRNRKHAKQATFGVTDTSANKSFSKWPKNK